MAAGNVSQLSVGGDASLPYGVSLGPLLRKGLPGQEVSLQFPHTSGSLDPCQDPQ